LRGSCTKLAENFTWAANVSLYLLGFRKTFLSYLLLSAKNQANEKESARKHENTWMAPGDQSPARVGARGDPKRNNFKIERLPPA